MCPILSRSDRLGQPNLLTSHLSTLVTTREQAFSSWNRQRKPSPNMPSEGAVNTERDLLCHASLFVPQSVRQLDFCPDRPLCPQDRIGILSATWQISPDPQPESRTREPTGWAYARTFFGAHEFTHGAGLRVPALPHAASLLCLCASSETIPLAPTLFNSVCPEKPCFCDRAA